MIPASHRAAALFAGMYIQRLQRSGALLKTHNHHTEAMTRQPCFARLEDSDQLVTNQHNLHHLRLNSKLASTIHQIASKERHYQEAKVLMQRITNQRAELDVSLGWVQSPPLPRILYRLRLELVDSIIQKRCCCAGMNVKHILLVEQRQGLTRY